jgi:hypothetical protein
MLSPIKVSYLLSYLSLLINKYMHKASVTCKYYLVGFHSVQSGFWTFEFLQPSWWWSRRNITWRHAIYGMVIGDDRSQIRTVHMKVICFTYLHIICSKFQALYSRKKKFQALHLRSTKLTSAQYSCTFHLKVAKHWPKFNEGHGKAALFSSVSMRPHWLLMVIFRLRTEKYLQEHTQQQTKHVTGWKQWNARN